MSICKQLWTALTNVWVSKATLGLKTTPTNIYMILCEPSWVQMRNIWHAAMHLLWTSYSWKYCNSRFDTSWRKQRYFTDQKHHQFDESICKPIYCSASVSTTRLQLKDENRCTRAHTPGLGCPFLYTQIHTTIAQDRLPRNLHFTSVKLELSGTPDLFLTFTAFHGGNVWIIPRSCSCSSSRLSFCEMRTLWWTNTNMSSNQSSLCQLLLSTLCNLQLYSFFWYSHITFHHAGQEHSELRSACHMIPVPGSESET